MVPAAVTATTTAATGTTAVSVLASVLTSPLAAVYGAVIRTRRALYDHGALPVHCSDVPVLSVGGLEAGGSGKTPVAGWLLQTLLRLGHRPGLLTRGYGRQTRGLVVREQGAPVDAAMLGDEPAMLVTMGLDVPVAACGRRRVGAAALHARGCDVLVLDDGFAHRALARQLDVVVLRGEAPFGTGRLLPWGSLREPPSSLERAQVVWLHDKNALPSLPVSSPVSPPAWYERFCPRALLVRSRAVPGIPIDGRGRPMVLPGTRVCGAAGIAWPRQFLHTLRAQGADVGDFAAFRDHHRYTAREVDMLIRRQKRCGAVALVVTAKDAIKLLPLWPDPASLWVLGTSVQVECGAAELQAFLKGLPFRHLIS